MKSRAACQNQTHPFVPKRLGSRNTELTAHSQVRHEYRARIERAPHKLSSANRRQHGRTGQGITERFRRTLVALQCADVKNTDVVDACTDEVGHNPPAYDLDLGKLRHG